MVNGVSIQVGPGEIVGLLGLNGAGKTTTFNIVVVRPDDGAVRFQGREVTSWPMHKRARLGMGYLTQKPSLFRKSTKNSDVKLSALIAKRPQRHSGVLSFT